MLKPWPLLQPPGLSSLGIIESVGQLVRPWQSTLSPTHSLLVVCGGGWLLWNPEGVGAPAAPIPGAPPVSPAQPCPHDPAPVDPGCAPPLTAPLPMPNVLGSSPGAPESHPGRQPESSGQSGQGILGPRS